VAAVRHELGTDPSLDSSSSKRRILSSTWRSGAAVTTRSLSHSSARPHTEVHFIDAASPTDTFHVVDVRDRVEYGVEHSSTRRARLVLKVTNEDATDFRLLLERGGGRG